MINEEYIPVNGDTEWLEEKMDEICRAAIRDGMLPESDDYNSKTPAHELTNSIYESSN